MSRYETDDLLGKVQTLPLTPPLVKGWEPLTKYIASLSLDKGRSKEGFVQIHY